MFLTVTLAVLWFRNLVADLFTRISVLRFVANERLKVKQVLYRSGETPSVIEI